MKLQVWWTPQVPMMKLFTVDVDSVQEGVKILDVLAYYDIFQFENNIKPDYCNAGGLRVWDDEENDWIDWYDTDTDETDPIKWLADKQTAEEKN